MIDPKAPCPLLTHEEAKQLHLLSSYTRSERAIIARAFRLPRFCLPDYGRIRDTPTARSVIIRHDPKETA